MPGPGVQFLGGPVQTGTQPTQTDFGTAILSQRQTITQNGTATVSATFVVPVGSFIVDILSDTTTAWNSGTSDTLSMGTSAGGTQFASGVDVKTSAGRVRPTFTATQLTNMGSIASPGSIIATVTPVGTAASAGSTTVTLEYVQTVQLTTGTS